MPIKNRKQFLEFNGEFVFFGTVSNKLKDERENGDYDIFTSFEYADAQTEYGVRLRYLGIDYRLFGE